MVCTSGIYYYPHHVVAGTAMAFSYNRHNSYIIHGGIICENLKKKLLAAFLGCVDLCSS